MILATAVQAAPADQYDWPDYAQNAGSTEYAALDQINETWEQDSWKNTGAGPVGAFSFSHVMVTKSLLFVTVTDGRQYISIAVGGMKKASLVTLALP
jgi:hypothetical protein